LAPTVISYIDRQTLSLLTPYLKLEYHWTNSDSGEDHRPQIKARCDASETLGTLVAIEETA
jgi:hypothetical protein